MCIESVKKFLKLLRERDALAWLILLIIAVYFVFLAFSPMFRYGDDARYFATAKTIALTGDLAPKYEMFGDTPFYGPPLLEYVLMVLYFVSFGNGFLWFFLGKLFEIAMFFGSLLLVYKFAGKFNLSKTEKIIALGFFSFLPISIYTSVSVMQDMVLAFFTLLLFWLLLKEKQNYAHIGIVSGFVMLSKFTGVLSIFAALLAILFMKNDKKTKALLIVSIIIGAALISGFWYYRNFLVFGNPIYHVGYDSYSSPLTQESVSEKLFNSYLSFWGIMPFSRVSEKLAIIPDMVFPLGVAAALFFLPVIFFFAKNAIVFRKKYLVFFPLLIAFSIFSFGYYNAFMGGGGPERFFLPVLGFFSIIVASARKLPKSALVYFSLCFIAFIFISSITTLYMANKENNYINSIKEIIKVNPEKNIVMLKSDFDMRLIASLLLNLTPQTVETVVCKNSVKTGNLNYCLDKNDVIIFR